MKPQRLSFPFVLTILLSFAVVVYLGVRFLKPPADQSLRASGTIEAVEISISSEVGGRVVEVYVEEGDTVRAGDRLFRLDDTLLQAERRLAVANLNLAEAALASAQAALQTTQANYTLALNAARGEDILTRTAAWRASFPSEYDLPGWYFRRAEELDAAQKEVETTRAALEAAQQKLDKLLNNPAGAEFLSVERRLLQARAAFLAAQDALDRAKSARDNEKLRESAQDAYDDAREELQDAQKAYDDLADRDIARDILSARAELAVAQERYEAAQDRLSRLQTGLYSPAVAVAQATLDQAHAALEQANRSVDQARANLAWIDARLEKLTVFAPADGVILTRAVQPGEVLTAGGVALTLARLEELTITVYVPEDRYGELTLGQSANVKVDSFPNETFRAVILRIAEKAEFTPRNVQTVEGRKTTVFAVKLHVLDPQGKLRPGMPADVVFIP